MQVIEKLDQRGYIVLELYLQLVVLVITSIGVALFLSVLYPVEEQIEATIPLEFELFLLEFESTATQLSSVGVGVHPCTLRMVTPDGTFLYEKYGSLIRKRKNNLGHEPVLQHVKSCEFKAMTDKILVNIQFTTGDVVEREIFIAPFN